MERAGVPRLHEQGLALVRAEHATMPLLHSVTGSRIEPVLETDLSALDAFEQHIWMTQNNENEFYKQVGYAYERFDPKGYRAVVAKAEAAYRARPEYWRTGLLARIDLMAAAGRKWNRPIMTTECWAVVDCKDWPMLGWGWVKELCEVGTKRASASGRRLAIATSNFRGPQFVGMWRDVTWHRALTDTIKRGPVDADLKTSKCGRGSDALGRLHPPPPSSATDRTKVATSASPRGLTPPPRLSRHARMDPLDTLEATIRSRRGGDPAASYVASLFAKGRGTIARKLGEEAVETVVAAMGDDPAEIVPEAADLLFHLLVLLADAGLTLDDVRAELARREGVSGHDEKAART